MEKLAKALLEKEVLFQSDVEALIGKRPFEHKKLLEEDTEEQTASLPPVENKETATPGTSSENPAS